MANSSCPGAPSLRTTNASNGAPSAAATSHATGIPPRGKPKTTTPSRPRYRAQHSGQDPSGFPAVTEDPPWRISDRSSRASHCHAPSLRHGVRQPPMGTGLLIAVSMCCTVTAIMWCARSESARATASSSPMRRDVPVGRTSTWPPRRQQPLVAPPQPRFGPGLAVRARRSRPTRSSPCALSTWLCQRSFGCDLDVASPPPCPAVTGTETVRIPLS